MGFKENLLIRLSINNLVRPIGKTTGKADSVVYVNKKAMQQRLYMSLFRQHRAFEQGTMIFVETSTW